MAVAENETKKEEVDIEAQFKIHLNKLFETYEKIDSNFPSSWFLFNNEGKFQLSSRVACHSALTYDGAIEWDDLVTAVPYSNEIDIAYIRMLMHGPFKAYSDLISLNKQGDNYYLHLTDLDKFPANVMYNFCVASRIPIEHKQLLEPWFKGVQLGYDPTLSFLLSYSTNGKPFRLKRNFNGDENQTNHFWFYKHADWKRILTGDMQRVSPPYKQAPDTCRPTNHIWGTARYHEEFANLEAEKISELLGLPIQPPAADPVPPPILIKKKPFHPNNYAQIQAAMEQIIQNQAVAPQQIPPAPLDMAAVQHVQGLMAGLGENPIPEWNFGEQHVPAEPQPAGPWDDLDEDEEDQFDEDEDEDEDF
jgi:hypothetical protein